MATEASPALHAVAGAVGGCMSLAATFPLVTVTMLLQIHQKKQRAQQQDDAAPTAVPSAPERAGDTDSLNVSVGPEGSSDAGSTSAASTPSRKRPPVSPTGRGAPPPPASLSTLQLVRKLVAESGGWQRLYSGLGSALYGQVAIQALYYYFYSWFNQILKRVRHGRASTLDPILAASAAGALGATLTNPIWVVSTRQVKAGTGRSLLAELLAMYKEEGVGSLFAGLLPALILVTNPTIQYGVFEYLKKRLGVTKNALVIFIVGAIAKLAATLVTYPYIVAKTTLQSQSNADSQATKYESTLACIRGVYEAEGLSGLYKGFDTKAYQSVSNSALMLLLHDRCLRVLAKLTR